MHRLSTAVAPAALRPDNLCIIPANLMLGKGSLSVAPVNIKYHASFTHREAFNRTLTEVHMLRLDQLEITGFKSFAEKTSIRFEEGISGIVGPNGCGKSNLADAIGWVLGSGTALSLRGEKMDDVIFNGTRKRRPSGVVEATLAFSRADNEPIVLKETEFSGEVLEISRKLYRSGESVYSVNQRRCRLKDVHSVLEEAGSAGPVPVSIRHCAVGFYILRSGQPLR